MMYVMIGLLVVVYWSICAVLVLKDIKKSMFFNIPQVQIAGIVGGGFIMPIVVLAAVLEFLDKRIRKIEPSVDAEVLRKRHDGYMDASLQILCGIGITFAVMNIEVAQMDENRITAEKLNAANAKIECSCGQNVCSNDTLAFLNK